MGLALMGAGRMHLQSLCVFWGERECVCNGEETDGGQGEVKAFGNLEVPVTRRLQCAELRNQSLVCVNQMGDFWTIKQGALAFSCEICQIRVVNYLQGEDNEKVTLCK